ncbi:MAG: FeoA family protein [Polyangiaceae bacterium]
MSNEAVSLASLGLGVSAVVSRVSGRRRTAVRLLELGLVSGTPIRIVRRAPLGDPLELEVRGYALSLRKEDAANVLVTLAAQESSAAAPAHGSSERVVPGLLRSEQTDQAADFG